MKTSIKILRYITAATIIILLYFGCNTFINHDHEQFENYHRWIKVKITYENGQTEIVDAKNGESDPRYVSEGCWLYNDGKLKSCGIRKIEKLN